MTRTHPAFHADIRAATDGALLAAVLIHLAALLLVPGVPAPEPAVFTPETEIFFEIAGEPAPIPAEPGVALRPKVPEALFPEDFFVDSRADVEETIRDTKVDIENPIDRLPKHGRCIDPANGAGTGAGAGRFETWSYPPSPRRLVQPKYPSHAREAGIEGRVVAEARVGTDGSVLEAWIVSSPSPVFDETVLRALRKSTFYPAKQKELAVESVVRVPYEFTLR